jgi:hypothetical protein
LTTPAFFIDQKTQIIQIQNKFELTTPAFLIDQKTQIIETQTRDSQTFDSMTRVTLFAKKQKSRRAFRVPMRNREFDQRFEVLNVI